LQDCIDVSRAIEANLDREKSKISLSSVSWSWFTIKTIRQYKKNVGRTLIVKTVNENLEAELVEANDDFVILSWSTRAKKKLAGERNCSKH
jgi:ribosome maturation factor RimP